MATADEYAQWIVDNEDKKGTEDFNTVVQAYNEAKAQESAPKQQEASPNVSPQAVSAVGQLAPVIPEGMAAVRQGVQTLANMPYQSVVRGAADIGSMMAGHPPYATMFKMATDTATGTPIKEVAANTLNTIRQGAGMLGSAAKGIGGAVARGIAAPESAVMMPYQMAAYEQEKIRQNPNAPGLEYNPYAQVQRGEAPTQRAAGAMNQRMAVANQRYGGLTAEEQAILDKDRLNMMMRVQAAKKVLGQQ